MIFNNNNICKINDLKINPFIGVDSYVVRKERQAMLSIYHRSI
jgi:hypothetical protein